MAITFFVPPLLLLLFSAAAAAKVETFTYVNEGEFGPYSAEYAADYRVLPVFASPFQMAFYNTTPGQFFLALRMATRRSESLFRWVWEANRGRPVGENATFSLRSDGNLVLAESGGKIVWSTGTANKGVVGLRLLPTGNIVLYDAKGRFVWQSFDYPTDTLLVGQSLRLGGATKLVSRKSAAEGSFGPYSFAMESGGLALYVNINGKSLPYYNYSNGQLSTMPVLSLAEFSSQPLTDFDGHPYSYELGLAVTSEEGKTTSHSGTLVLARPKYNATLSFLRLEMDGNLVAYTYYDPVDYQAWEKTFAFFDDRTGLLDGCQLPSKCGGLGVCEEEMCVACPTSRGLLGWSKGCAGPAPACNAGHAVKYYKVVGVENLLTRYTKGEERVGVEECRRRCSVDCKCLGFFYWEKEAKCWLAPTLGTLSKVSDSTHVAYIRAD